MPTEINDAGEQLLLDGAVKQRTSPMIELGATGLKRSAGYVNEEFLPALRGRKAVQVFREMSLNDPIISALLFAVDRLLRQLEWRVEPASHKSEDKQAAEFVEQCMDDMSHTWDEFITEALTMLPYGWSYHEIVYKKRIGPWEKDGKSKSKYRDGKIGWRKLPIRSQETLQRWVFDERGGIKGMIQIPPPKYNQIYLPIDRCLLFRVSTAKNNPEGVSFLRGAYRPWYFKKRLEEIEGIGVERDLAGLPVAKVPHDYLSAKKGTDKAKMVEAFKKMVRTVRRDEQEGVVIPVAYDQDTKQPLFDFQLMTSGGGRTFNTSEMIQRYEQRMLMTVLADFIMVGHSGQGSYALHTDKTGLFRASINSVAQAIADVLNRYAIPKLFAVNGWRLDELPQIKPGEVDPPDLIQLATFMQAMGSAGVSWFPDAELEKFIRKAAKLPELDESTEELLETQKKQTQVLSLAQAKLQLIQTKQQAEQGMMQTEQQKLGLQQHEMGMEQQAQQMQGPQGDPRLQQEQQMGHQDAQFQQKAAQQDEDHQQRLKHREDAHKAKMQQMRSKR